jgi:hypothetical protein
MSTTAKASALHSALQLAHGRNLTAHLQTQQEQQQQQQQQQMALLLLL